jgi:hypothetical protein
VQICLMGTWDDRALEILPEVLATHAQACTGLAPAEDRLAASA